MRKWIVAGVFVLALAIVTTSWAHGRQREKVLEFKTMVGVVPPYTGATNAIRGIPGPPPAWRIDEAEGKLRSNGDLEIEVEGLTLLNGVNPQAFFRAIVSCQSIQGGVAVVVNRVTAQFPATATGDAEFDGSVSLPSPCIAPIIFVTNGAGTVWFSVTGV